MYDKTCTCITIVKPDFSKYSLIRNKFWTHFMNYLFNKTYVLCVPETCLLGTKKNMF